jgi:hypothetical protein
MFAGATLLLYLAAPGAFAAPITYTLSGPVSGTLGATPFTNAQITIVATGDTSTVDCGAPIFCNTLSSVTFTINGVGSGTVTDGLSIFDATVGTLGLERTTGGLVDWIDHDAIEFQTFNLATSLGPITVAPRTPQVAVATTAGGLNLTSGPTTFQSVATGGGGGPTATTTVVISSVNPSVVGQSVTTQGTHSITAVFSGDANNATSTSSAVVQTVNASVVPPPQTNPTDSDAFRVGDDLAGDAARNVGNLTLAITPVEG